MELDRALDLAKTHTRSVLIAHRGDGRSQPSNVVHWVGDDRVVRVSITDTRAKTKNLRRDPRCELYIVGDNHWRYLVLDCDVELTPVAADPQDDTVNELVEYYRVLSGEHPDWDDYRRAMVADQRLVARLRPTRAFGMWTGD